MADETRDTRQRLLDAAETLFADRGFDAVSVRDIAAAAEVNLAAVNYHFHGKQRLYLEVLDRVVSAKRDRYLAAMRAAAARGGDLESMVRAFYRAHFEDTLKNEHGRNFLKLFVRELHHGSTEGAQLLQEKLLPMWREGGELLLARAGGADPALVPWIVGSLHGQLVHFTMRWHKSHDCVDSPRVGETLRRIFPPLADDVDTYIDQAVEHITCFCVAGIRAVIAASPGRGAQPMESMP